MFGQVQFKDERAAVHLRRSVRETEGDEMNAVARAWSVAFGMPHDVLRDKHIRNRHDFSKRTVQATGTRPVPSSA